VRVVGLGAICDLDPVGNHDPRVLTTVLPDGDDIDEKHPWEWLAELAQAHGIDVTADDLRQVPYEVVLTERVLQRLPNTPPSTRSA
jgi:hypothetical protein